MIRKHKIAIQGAESSFHHLAAKKLFGENVLTENCHSFEEVCQNIKANNADYGVMAIENLLTGCILTNYYLIEKYDLNIIGETKLPISLHLLGTPNSSIENIKKVISHPIALAQCNKLISANPWETEQVSDTATSAREIAEKNDQTVAAIANETMAEQFSLKVLQKEVQNLTNNYTRFLVLSNKKVKNDQANKACVSFNLEHAHGSLVKALQIVADHEINLSKIQSVPIPNTEDSYTIFMDIEWTSTINPETALQALSEQVQNFNILGTYIKDKMIS